MWTGNCSFPQNGKRGSESEHMQEKRRRKKESWSTELTVPWVLSEWGHNVSMDFGLYVEVFWCSYTELLKANQMIRDNYVSHKNPTIFVYVLTRTSGEKRMGGAWTPSHHCPHVLWYHQLEEEAVLLCICVYCPPSQRWHPHSLQSKKYLANSCLKLKKMFWGLPILYAPSQSHLGFDWNNLWVYTEKIHLISHSGSR